MGLHDVFTELFEMLTHDRVHHVPAWPTKLIAPVRRSVGRSEEVRNGSTAPITGRGAATVEIRNT